MTPADPRRLLPGGNLFDFFRERVESAVRHQRAPVSEDTVYYLSSLLADEARPGEEAAEGSEDTLAGLRHRAVTSRSPGEAAGWWRRLGDRSLLLAGFFREHLERRRISRDYCARLGAGAYRSLELLGGARRDGFASVYGELSERYPVCVDVLEEVREEARERTDTDIVQLYEDWLQRGSPRAAERLRALGVVPVRTRAAG